MCRGRNNFSRQAKDTKFAKRYLSVLVDEIVVDGETATMKCSYVKLAIDCPETEKDTSKEVPFSVFVWCARKDESGQWFEVMLVP